MPPVLQITKFADLDSWTISGLMPYTVDEVTACVTNGGPEIIMNGGFHSNEGECAADKKLKRSTMYTRVGIQWRAKSTHLS